MLDPPELRTLPFAEGDELTFGITLFGRAAEHLPYVVVGLKEMAERGLGTARARFRLVEVVTRPIRGESTCIFEEDAALGRAAPEPLASHLDGAQAMPRATLRLLTPTRLAEKGGLTRQPGFDVVVRSLLMRGLAMRHVHGGADVDFDISGLVERARTATTVGSDLRLHRLNRRSSRQKALVPLDGMVGTITFEGEAVAELWPLLLAGELLHLGKGTAFRCGRYVIERGDSAAARPETGDA